MTWTPIADLTGPAVEMRQANDYLQWRVAGSEAAWENLIPLSAIQGLPGMDSTPADDAIAGFMGTAGTSATKTATSELIGKKTFVVDTDYASLEAALTATPEGGVLEVRGSYSRSTTFTIDKAVTVRFAHGGQIAFTDTDEAVITVTANNVAIEGATLTGPGNATAGLGHGIIAEGTSAAPITGLRITGARISAISYIGIYLENVTNFTIENTNVWDVAYGGIMVASALYGEITNCTITNVTMPTGFVNAYGIAMSRDSLKSMADGPRSAYITVRDCTVNGVPAWEGIDTHAGQNLNIINNTVLNCNVGIAIVSGKDASNASAYGATGIVITGNTIDGRNSTGAIANGINIAGAGTAVDTAAEFATAVIANNTIIDCGNDPSAATGQSGAVQLSRSKGVILSGNTIVRAGSVAVKLTSANFGVIIADTVVEDVWANTNANAVAVMISSAYNTVTISGTQITRGAKTATLVNDRGVWAATSNVVVTDGGGNQWSAATTIANNDLALKASAYGVTPVARAVAITTPASDTSGTKVAIDAIRAALKNYGITL